MDLPKDAFLQWVGWVMSPRYLFDDARLEALQNFPNYKGALRALCMSDDPWATRPAVELLCSGLPRSSPRSSPDARDRRRRQWDFSGHDARTRVCQARGQLRIEAGE